MPAGPAATAPHCRYPLATLGQGLLALASGSAHAQSVSGDGNATDAWFLLTVLGLVFAGFLLLWLNDRRRARRELESRAVLQRRQKQQLDLVLATSGDVVWELDVRSGVLHRQGHPAPCWRIRPRRCSAGEVARGSGPSRRRRATPPLVERHVNGETEYFESEHRIRHEDRRLALGARPRQGHRPRRQRQGQ
jgi:hypothetical protein